jgi:phytanoyl-CoA hydroxylase
MTYLLTTEDRCLSADEMIQYRQHAEAMFGQLKEQAAASSAQPPSPSWVCPDDDDDDDDDADTNDPQLENSKRSEQSRYLDAHGFLVVPQFADPNQVQELKEQMAHLANHDWNPNAALDTFGTDSASNTKRGDYFLDSGNKVHYFAEPTALVDKDKNKDKNKDDDDKEGGQQQQQQQLKPEFETDKLAALNKAGHGMHTIPGSFRDYTLSPKMRDLVTDLGWTDPVVPQSMYIFKQPQIGGTVHSHQDSTFLFTEPRQTCLGLWLALDDATLENGCLWVRPGSHREPLRRQFIRNPDYFDKQDPDPSASKLIFRTHHDDPNMTWEGGLPESLSRDGFVPVEVKAGDLVTFCGTLDHLSLPNFSEFQRHTFQLHLVEGPKEGIRWSQENWLQYPEDIPFVRLIE